MILPMVVGVLMAVRTVLRVVVAVMVVGRQAFLLHGSIENNKVT